MGPGIEWFLRAKINAFISGSTSSDQICSEHFRENTRWRAASGEVPIGLTNVTGTTACT